MHKNMVEKISLIILSMSVLTPSLPLPNSNYFSFPQANSFPPTFSPSLSQTPISLPHYSSSFPSIRSSFLSQAKIPHFITLSLLHPFVCLSPLPTISSLCRNKLSKDTTTTTTTQRLVNCILYSISGPFLCT